MLSLAAVSAGYGSFRALFDVSLEVAAGEAVGVIGPNGAGKTTLMRVISGLIPLISGTMTMDGKPIAGLPAHRIIEHGIAHVPENRRLFPRLTVEENLRIGAYIPAARAHFSEQLSYVYDLFPRLKDRSDQLAGTMSGGEQAMVSIGRGLMCAPKLLLIDEPSLGLSPRLVKENFNIIRQINERGITVLLVEQNVHQTLAISHFGFVISKGRVATSGTPSELAGRSEVRDAYFG